jgi:hypothetical protein
LPLCKNVRGEEGVLEFEKALKLFRAQKAIKIVKIFLFIRRDSKWLATAA